MVFYSVSAGSAGGFYEFMTYYVRAAEDLIVLAARLWDQIFV